MQDVRSRRYDRRADVLRVRDLLSTTFSTAPRGLNWETRRWEGSNYYCTDAELADPSAWERLVQLWEMADGTLVGVAHADRDGWGCLQVHPDWRALEPEMIAWCEQHLSVPTEDSTRRQLYVEVMDGDALREDLLAGRGYERLEGGMANRWRSLDAPIVDAPVVPGYTVRGLRPGPDDRARLVALTNAAFGHQHTTEMYANFERSPSYRHDLHLVAEASDGSFAALAGVTFDPIASLGTFEPVCTHPDHRRRRLALACMVEGLRRLRALGAAGAHVSTGLTNPSNHLYAAAGFTAVDTWHVWRRVW
jgi:predicted N-acetyltransferase YhbS